MSHVSQEASDFYGVDEDTVDILASSFFVTVVVLGLYAMYLLDNKSLRFGVCPNCSTTSKPLQRSYFRFELVQFCCQLDV